MAQSRLITDLVELVTPGNDDVLVIVDNTTSPSLSATKKIKYSSLIESLQDMIDLLVQEGTGISATYSDVGNTLTISVVADTTVQKTIYSSGGTAIGTRQELNVIPGAGITLSGVDNGGSNRVDLTVNTTAVATGITLSGTGSPVSPLESVSTLGDGTKQLNFRGIKAGSSKIAVTSGDAGNSISVDVVPSGININDLNTSSPLAIALGGTNATTAANARASLGAAKAGANSDITELSGLTTPLSVSQGGIGADTALQGLKNLAGLKYITSVAVAGQSLVANDTTLVSNEYRGELRGVKAGSSKVTVGTDGNDISIDVNPDDVLSAATQNVDLQSFRIVNLATPVGAQDAATRAYVDQVSAGLIVKESVLAATVSGIAGTYLGSPNFTLTVTGTGVPDIDGLSITDSGASVLIKDQSTASQNGIYTLTTPASSGVSAIFTRRADSNSDAEVVAGTFTFVASGSINGGKQFVQATASPTLDTTALVYTILNDTTIADGSVINAKLADMPANTIKGVVTSGIPQDLSANHVVSVLNTGTSKLAGAILPGASTSASGIVQLESGVTSTSASTAATAGAVKIAYDLAVAAMPTAGGTFSGAVSGLTAVVGTDNTQLATTAFVNAEIANDAPSKLGVGASGTWNISVTGNAGSASVLQNARTITLAGDLSGSASFNGGSNITITGVVADDSHDHIISNVDGLQAALDAKASLTSPAFSGTPTAPTAASGTIDTQIATTAFVAAAISGVQGGAVTSADRLTTARTINTVSFDGTADIVVEPFVEDDEATNALRYLVFVDNSTAGHKRLNEDSGLNYNPSTGTLTTTVFSGALSGNASTATSATSASQAAILTTARTIALDSDVLGSASFNGSTDITITSTIANKAISNAKLADMPALTIKGVTTSGAPQNLTANQTIGILNSGTTKLVASVLASASTTASGVVQLNNTVTSTSTTDAATANAVKTAYDVAVAASGVAGAALPASGGTMNGSFASNVVAVSALNIDCATGNYFTKTISGDSTFTVSNVPASGSAYGFTLKVVQTSGTITWFSGVTWPRGIASPATTTGKTHMFMFVTDDGGVRWRGAALVDYTN